MSAQAQTGGATDAAAAEAGKNPIVFFDITLGGRYLLLAPSPSHFSLSDMKLR